MRMKILEIPIAIDELKKIAHDTFGDLVKVVVDVERELVALDAELHSDLESLLLDNGSEQSNLWGINFYPDMTGDEFIEFDSMINIRPSQGNINRGVSDESIRKKIIEIVNQWVKK
jgi:hypothetical protein